MDDNRTVSLRGTVLNSVTHEPIGHALVFSTDNRFATMTDSDGHFEFTFPQAPAGGGSNGPSMLSARKPGFLPDPVAEEQNLAAGKEVSVTLIPEALIVGHVALPYPEASSPIQVQLLRRQVRDGRVSWDTQMRTSTRSDGEFRFADLPAGTYKLLTQEALDRDPEVFSRNEQVFGYPPAFFPAAMDISGAAAIELSAGTTFQADLSLIRRDYYQVKVPVQVPQPNDGVMITVSLEGHAGPGYSLGYTPRDQAITGMLPNGHYTIEASTAGQNSASGLVTITVNGAAYEGPRMTLLPDHSITVNVREEFTSPDNPEEQVATVGGGLRHANQRRQNRYLNISLEPADEFVMNRGASSHPVRDSDVLMIDGVSPGRYWLRVYTDHGYIASANAGGTDLLRRPLVVGLGGASPSIEVTLRDDNAQIEGTIEGAENSPASFAAEASSSTRFAYAFVYCVPTRDSSGQFTEVGVTPEGKFGIQAIPPGEYRVLAFKRPHPELEYRNPEAMQVYEGKGQVVRLVTGQAEHLRLPLIVTTE